MQISYGRGKAILYKYPSFLIHGIISSIKIEKITQIVAFLVLPITLHITACSSQKTQGPREYESNTTLTHSQPRVFELIRKTHNSPRTLALNRQYGPPPPNSHPPS